MKRIEKRFKITKYSINDIVRCINKNYFEKSDCEDLSEICEISYADLKRSDFRKTVTIQPDCALFYQLLYTADRIDGRTGEDSYIFQYNSCGSDSKKLSALSSILSDKLIYVKFEYSASANLKVIDTIFKNGFNITFSDDKDAKPVKFVYFEASGSMRRGATLSFIAEKYKQDLLERLTFGMPFNGQTVNLSKYWAYKGLYLTSGHRVNTVFGKTECEKEEKNVLKLDDKTVVIVKDYTDSASIDTMVDFEKVEVERTEAKEKNGKTKTKKNGEIIYNETEINKDPALKDEDLCFSMVTDKKYNYYRIEKNEKKVSVKLFDGEGLISKKYADIIAEAIKNDNDDADHYSSFQVRGPFIKGMLHRVSDVNENGKSVPGIKWFFDKCGITTIKDKFGVEHNVDDVEIILTESMFKCIKWLPNNTVTKDKTKTEWFWDKCSEYDHALYVAGSNNPGEVPKYTTLNSQVLSTIGIKDDAFDGMVCDFYTSVRDMRCNDYAFLAYLSKIYGDTSEYKNEEESDDGTESGDEQSNNADRQSEGNLYYNMIKKNPACINIPSVNKLREDLFDKELSEFSLAHIPAEGGYFYLSGNLMELLFEIAVQDKTKEEKGKLMDESKYDVNIKLLESKFYAPNSKLKEGEYAFFRNPHLSQLEHVVLNRYHPADGNWMLKLFGGLRRVVMVDSRSLVPMQLGGADFDGDGVKIIKEQHYLEAVKSFNKKSSKKIVNIPSPIGKDSTPDDVDSVRDMLMSTFSSQTGRYSNCAFEHALKAYNFPIGAAECETERKITENMTAIVGLEIDSAKNGAKPEILLPLEAEEKSNFIRHKTEFKKSKKRYTLSKISSVKKTDWDKKGKKDHNTEKGDNEGSKEDDMIPILKSYFPVRLEKKRMKYLGNHKEYIAPVERLGYMYLCMKFATFRNDLINESKKISRDDFKKYFKGENVKLSVTGESSLIFNFESEPDWYKKLNEEKLLRTLGLILAYKKATQNIFIVYDARSKKYKYENSKNNLSRIVMDQCSDIGADIEKAVSKIKDALGDRELLYTDISCIKKLLKSVNGREKSGVWQYGSGDLENFSKINNAEKIWEKFCKVFNGESGNGLTDKLKNFKFGGYNILYYVIDAALMEYKNNDDIKQLYSGRKTLESVIRKLIFADRLKKENAIIYEKLIKAIEDNMLDSDDKSFDRIISEAISEDETVEEKVKEILAFSKSFNIEDFSKNSVDVAVLEDLPSSKLILKLHEEGYYNTDKNLSDFIEKNISEIISRKDSSEIIAEVDQYKEKHLEIFSGINTEYEYRSDCEKELKSLCIGQLAKIFGSKVPSRNQDFKKEALRYIFFLSSQYDKNWIFLKNMCGKKVILDEVIDCTGNSSPIMNNEEHDEYVKNLNGGKDMYTNMSFRGTEYYILSGGEVKDGVK